MAVGLLLFCVDACEGLTARVRGCAQGHIPPPGSTGVPSLWHHCFWGRGLKSLGITDLEGKVAYPILFLTGRLQLPDIFIFVKVSRKVNDTKKWNKVPSN